jgi:hypothetical protein
VTPATTGSLACSRRELLALAVAWFLAIGTLLMWMSSATGGMLREQLKSIQFWSLEACVILGLALGAIIARDHLKRLGRRDRLRMAGLMALALALTLFVAPRTNRIYYDEQIYQSIGQNLADLKLAQMCNDGTVEYGRLQCWSGEYNKQPYAYPHLLSLAYRVFGVIPAAAFALNAAVMAMTVGMVYLLTLMLFDDGIAAFYAGLLVALIPQQLVWSATAAVEPSASLACVVAIAACVHFIRSRSTVALVAAGVSAAYAIQFRPESLLVLPVIGLLLWHHARSEFRRARLWWVGLLFVALLAAHVGHLFAVRNEGWGAIDAPLSLGYVAANLRVNGRFYLGDERFPFVFTLLAVAGLFGRRFRTERVALLGYFVLFFAIDLLFYAGSYNYGADVRYSLMTYPPLAILGGLGLARAVRWAHRAYPALPAHAAATAALAFQFLWYTPIVRSTTEEAWAARADVRFARSFVASLPPNSYVLTHNPGMFQVWGINAGQMSLIVSSPGYLKYLTDRYAGGVYLHWNFWCNVQDPVQRAFCRQVLENRPAEMVGEYRERDQRYAIYRLAATASQNHDAHSK